MAHIEHGFLNVANLVAQKIDCHHRKCAVSVLHVLGIGIVNAKVLTET